MNKDFQFSSWVKNNRTYILGYIIFLIVFLALHGERIINNYKSQGTVVTSQNYTTHSGEQLSFPIIGKNTILLFWASWCAPCKIEMNRLKKSVGNGTINRDSIYLLNPFEDQSTIVAFLKKSPYPFTFLIDNDQKLTRQLNITQTPTTLFLKGLEIEKMSSGISITGILEAESFLKVPGTP